MNCFFLRFELRNIKPLLYNNGEREFQFNREIRQIVH